MAAIEYRGLNAVTNFDLSRYIKWLRPNNQEEANADANPNLNPSHELQLGFCKSLDESETLSRSDAGGSSSALEMLLQSSKFKEMLEKTSTGDNTSSSTTSSSEVGPSRRSFPDDIQTYFDCQDSGDDVIFGDLSSFLSPMIFSCEFYNQNT